MTHNGLILLASFTITLAVSAALHTLLHLEYTTVKHLQSVEQTTRTVCGEAGWGVVGGRGAKVWGGKKKRGVVYE